MAWSDFLFEQANLEKICRRPAVWATEYHLQNQLYGGHCLLKEYAGLDPHCPLPWAMEHFINFEDPIPYAADDASQLPILATVAEPSPHLTRHARRVVPIGSLYFYMRAIAEQWYPELSEPVARRGTLVMPAKSTQHKSLDFDRGRFAAELAALPEEFHPVVVSIFYRDYERGTHRPYEEAGLHVVGSGHPYDPLFLFRQYDLCRRFRYACANEISTSFCLSVLSGCRFFFHETTGLHVVRDAETLKHVQEGHADLPTKLACRQASPFPPHADGSEQTSLAEHFAGARFVRSPEFLRQLADDGRATLRASIPHEIDFDTGVRMDALAAWSTQGIDVDGCALERFELTVPSGTKAGAVAIDVCFGPDGHTAEWRLTLDGTRVHRFRPQPDGVRILVPCTPGRATRVAFAAEHPTRLPEPVRRRSARVVRLRLLDCSIRSPAVLPFGSDSRDLARSLAIDAPIIAPASRPPPRRRPRPIATALPNVKVAPRFFGRLYGLAPRSRPFEHATCVDGFDAHTVAALVRELPAADCLGEWARAEPERAKQGRVCGVELLADPRFGATWKALVEEGLSQRHYLRWLALFRPCIDRRYPDLDARFGRLETLRAVPRQSMRPGAGEVGLECQLAFHVPGTITEGDDLPPHLDRPQKLIAALIHLRWPGDRSIGGELEFYAPVEPVHCFESYRRLPRTSVRPTHVFPRDNGRLVTFLNSRDALHGSAPRQAAESPSLCIALAVEFPEPVFPIPLRNPVSDAVADPVRPDSLPWRRRVAHWLRGRRPR